MKKNKGNGEMQVIVDELARTRAEVAELRELTSFLCNYDKNHILYVTKKGTSGNHLLYARFVYKDKIKEINFYVSKGADKGAETIANTPDHFITKVNDRFFKIMKERGTTMEVTEFFTDRNFAVMKGGSMALICENKTKGENE